MTTKAKERPGGHAVRPPRTRNTTQRKAVLDAVRGLAGQHPTAADVFAAVRRAHPQMSLATVYRALHALVVQRAVTEVRAENVARYDVGAAADGSPAASPHHHLVCRVCGAVEDVSAAAVPAALLRAVEAAAGGFALDLHPVQFTGVCAGCRPPGPGG